MKRVLICGAALGALLVPAEVFGKAISRDVYLGELEDVKGSEVRLKTRTQRGESDVVAFTVRDVPVKCEGGERFILSKTTIRGRIPVGKRGGFRAADDNGETTFKVSGRVGKNKASGRFRFFGEMDAGDRTEECDTRGHPFLVRHRR